MFEVNINMTFKTKTHERGEFIVKQIYRARKKLLALNITSGSRINSSIRPISKD